MGLNDWIRERERKRQARYQDELVEESQYSRRAFVDRDASLAQQLHDRPSLLVRPGPAWTSGTMLDGSTEPRLGAVARFVRVNPPPENRRPGMNISDVEFVVTDLEDLVLLRLWSQRLPIRQRLAVWRPSLRSMLGPPPPLCYVVSEGANPLGRVFAYFGFFRIKLLIRLDVREKSYVVRQRYARARWNRHQKVRELPYDITIDGDRVGAITAYFPKGQTYPTDLVLETNPDLSLSARAVSLAVTILIPDIVGFGLRGPETQTTAQ